MPLEEGKAETKKTIEHISATGILALLLLTAGPPAPLLVLPKFLSVK